MIFEFLIDLLEDGLAKIIKFGKFLLRLIPRIPFGFLFDLLVDWLFSQSYGKKKENKEKNEK